MSVGHKRMNFISLCIVLLLLVALTLATSTHDLDKDGRSLPYIRARRSPCQGKNCHSSHRRSEPASYHHRAKINRRSKGCGKKSPNDQSTPDSSQTPQDGDEMAQRLKAVEKAMDAEQSLMGGAEWTKKMLQQNGQGSTVEYTQEFQWSNVSGGSSVTSPQLAADTNYDKKSDTSQATKQADDDKKKQDEQREQERKAAEAKKQSQADEQKKEEDEKAREVEASEKQKADEKEKEAEQQKAKEAEEQEKQKEKSEQDAKYAQKAESDRQAAAAQAAEKAKENESQKPVEKVDPPQPNKFLKVLTPNKPPTQSGSSGSSDSDSDDSQSQQASNSAQFSSFEKSKHSDNPGESDSARWVKLHNNIRARYLTGPVQWDGKLAQYAQGVANTCVFEHSHGPYGENIAAGETDLARVVNDWAYGTDENKSYNPDNPTYSHFTQLIWKGTTRIGCAVKDCGNIADVPWKGDSKFWVCSYDPPGNYAGEFIANVKCAKGGAPLAE